MTKLGCLGSAQPDPCRLPCRRDQSSPKRQMSNSARAELKIIELAYPVLDLTQKGPPRRGRSCSGSPKTPRFLRGSLGLSTQPARGNLVLKDLGSLSRPHEGDTMRGTGVGSAACPRQPLRRGRALGGRPLAVPPKDIPGGGDDWEGPRAGRQVDLGVVPTELRQVNLVLQPELTATPPRPPIVAPTPPALDPPGPPIRASFLGLVAWRGISTLQAPFSTDIGATCILRCDEPESTIGSPGVRLGIPLRTCLSGA